MVKAANTGAIERATGTPWSQWVARLETAGARALEHGRIAELALANMPAGLDNPGWWAQGVAVAFEQEIGRRAPGQKNDGSFEASVTKTVPGSLETVFDALVAFAGEPTELNGLAVNNVRTSVTPVRSYWRADGADGTRIQLVVESRGAEKSMVGATVTKIDTAAARDQWRDFFRSYLTDFAATL